MMKNYVRPSDRYESHTNCEVKMHTERRVGLQSPACEDSGVATSGELGEPSCSGEYDGVVCVVQDSQKKEGANQDPR